mmetsp:Transcript_25755/g.71930  ORF Transcript_25755/g.71930 Transcript_25755/m.71930 type:complete len:171 (+) Transcript_25755:3-515(+)
MMKTTTTVSVSLLLLLHWTNCITAFLPLHPHKTTTTTQIMSSTNNEIKEIKTDNAPAPVGPYSQAVQVAGTLYCSGQIALDPTTGDMINDNVQDETRQIFVNMDAVLKEAGTTKDRIVRCTVFLVDLNDFGLVNEIYAEYFGDVKPSRSCVQVSALPKGAKVEIDCIAVL